MRILYTLLLLFTCCSSLLAQKEHPYYFYKLIAYDNDGALERVMVIPVVVEGKLNDTLYFSVRVADFRRIAYPDLPESEFRELLYKKLKERATFTFTEKLYKKFQKAVFTTSFFRLKDCVLSDDQFRHWTKDGNVLSDNWSETVCVHYKLFQQGYLIGYRCNGDCYYSEPKEYQLPDLLKE